MKQNRGTLVAGSILIGFGLLALLGQLFRGLHVWDYLWPVILIAIGGLFFVGMFAGGKSTAGLAIPGTIVGLLGLTMLLQSLTGYWQSWSYSWTVILISVGLGIFLMGAYEQNEHRRRAGMQVLKVGVILFIIFGGLFELIFSAIRPYGVQRFVFPVLMVLLGVYLVVVRSGLIPSRRKDADVQPADLSVKVEK